VPAKIERVSPRRRSGGHQLAGPRNLHSGLRDRPTSKKLNNDSCGRPDRSPSADAFQMRAWLGGQWPMCCQVTSEVPGAGGEKNVSTLRPELRSAQTSATKVRKLQATPRADQYNYAALQRTRAFEAQTTLRSTGTEIDTVYIAHTPGPPGRFPPYGEPEPARLGTASVFKRAWAGAGSGSARQPRLSGGFFFLATPTKGAGPHTQQSIQ